MKRVTRIFIWLLVGIFALLGLIVVFIQSPTGQDFLTKQTVSYLRKKLGTPLSIQKVRFHIPDWVSLEGVYIEDQKKDTLLAGGRLYIDVDMLGLLQNEVKLNQIELDRIRVKINRTLPDTAFNFNYIIKAFASTTPADTAAPSKPFDISLQKVKMTTVKITYKDAVIGTDAEVYLKALETEFNKFNLAKSQYHIANLTGNGGTASMRLYKPLKEPVVAVDATPDPIATKDTLDLNVGKVNILNLSWLLESEVDDLRNGVKIGRFEVEGDNIYLEGQQVKFKKVLLENSEAFVEFTKKAKPVKLVTPAPKTTDTTSTSTGWIANINDIQLNKVQLRYDDFNSPNLAKGLDYSHLDVKNLALSLKNFIFSPNKIAGQLTKSSFTEKSGLVLQNLTTTFNYADKETSLKGLLLKTPNTLIRDELVMQYNAMSDLTENLGNVRLKVNLKQSQLAIKDLLTLVPTLETTPALKDNKNDIIKADGILTGRVNNLTIPKLSISGFGGTRLQAKGTILGLPDANKLGFNVDIQEITSTKKDILKILGPDALPESIELPEKITVKGLVKGKVDNLQVDATIASDLGGAAFTGQLMNFAAGKNQKYDGKLTLQDFDAGKFIKQPENVGKLTLVLNAKGTGIDPKTMNATIDGTAQKAVLKGYEYNNLILKGNIQNQIANVDATLADPNADFKLTSRVDLSKPYPAVDGDISINNLDLKKLNLYAEDLSLKGDIKVNMESTDPNNPIGKIVINQAVIQTGGKSIPIDTTDLTIQNLPSGRNIVLNSPFIKAQVDGNFNYTQIPDILLTEVNKYFALPGVTYKPVTESYDFSIKAKVNQHPVLQSFVPALTKLDTVRLVARLDNKIDTTLKASLYVPLVEYDSSLVRNARLNLFALGNTAFYSGTINQINVSDFQIRRTSLNGQIADNTLTTKILLKDSLDVDRFAIAARVKSVDGKYRLNLSERGTLIDYREWRSDSTGYVEYSDKGIVAKQFLLAQNGQRLLVNSITDEPNSPLQITIDSLDIKPFVFLATLDSTLAAGKLNGDIKLSNYMTTPSFTGDLVINNLAVTQIPVGNLNINATNETENKITTKASLVSNKNDIRVEGSYLLKAKNSLDFVVDIKKLGAETIQAFSFGQLKYAKGNIGGNFTLKGETTKPVINGEITFDSVALVPTQLGSKYIFRNQKLVFQNSDLQFNKFVIADTLGQNLVITGNLNLQNIPNFTYKLDVDAKNFMVLNGSRKDNDFFYGKGFVDADLNIRGVGAKPAIEGSVKLKENSDITIILPDQSIGETETDGIVQFVNMKNPASIDSTKTDSTAIATTFDFASEMSLNIEADDKSQLTIVIDELNGDNLKVNGNVQLNTGITPSGQFYIFGLYELTSGKYDLTFQVLKRQFTIEKGSTLLWTGDPMKAQINITAGYPIETELTALSEDAKVYGKVPLKVLLKMQGNLSNPTIDFEITVDKTKASSDVISFVESNPVFTSLTDNPVLMNKQVFALLVLGRFIGEQSSDFFSGINPEAIARQSVSKLLTDQLNVLAGDLIKGVKLDFNLNSATLESQTGSLGNKTDLNIGLSKAFLNDRLTVSVGRNFQIENTADVQKNSTEIFDNIALNYNLSKDGRYMFRAYRKNEYFILDGYVQETGVSFAVTLDYENFRELFNKKR